jgi:hypothetical protein
VTVLDLLSGGLGLGIIVAGMLVALVLEVVDQLAADRPRDAPGPRLSDPASRVLRIALVVLVVASLAATLIRVFIVVR